MIIIIKHIEIEGPGIIKEFFDNTNYSAKTYELYKKDILPEDFSKIEAIITLGGPANVYEEGKYPFLKNEQRFLDQAKGLKIPTIGICLGAQIIAKTKGARIKKAASKEIGWHKINFTRAGLDDPLFQGLKAQEEFFQWHQDQFDVPKGAYLLADSSVCPQAFRFGKNVYGLQFHFEVTPLMIESWVEEYAKDLKYDNGFVQEMILNAYKRQEEFHKKCQRVLLNFARIIENSVRERN